MRPFSVDYRERLYYRGSVATKRKKVTISQRILKQEIAAGFKVSGAFTRRLGYFTDGLILGAEEVVLEMLARLINIGKYRRRINPIRTDYRRYFYLRHQRAGG